MPALHDSLPEAFWQQVRMRADQPCLVRKVDGRWIPITWEEAGEKVARLASAFLKSGLKTGDRVAIYSDNCVEWVLSDFACMTSGLVSVPIYPSLNQEQVTSILEHSDCKAIIVRGEDRFEKIKNFEILKVIIGKTFDVFLKTGGASPDNKITKEDLATIVYTSGTTGEAKGVMLSHGNILSQAQMLGSRAIRKPDDVVISYLPLSHITERANIFRQAIVGYPLYFAQSFDTVSKDVLEIRPTSFVAVPRIWEKYYEAIKSKKPSGSMGKIFDLAVKTGTSYVTQRKTGRVSKITKIKSAILQKIIGSSVKKNLGFDRCRLFISGAAPLDFNLLGFFHGFGITIVEAFGMTECSGGSHINHEADPSFGSVGPCLDGMQAKIAEDGELLLKGPNVFVGYFKNPEQTRETIRNGWLHTGDIGVIDKYGCLTITDRKKNIIITSGGKNIAPSALEFKLKRHKLISQVVVIGDKRKYLTALVTLNAGISKAEAENQIQKHLEEVNSSLSSFETIKKFTILEKDFSPETGELTPTLKTKRNFIQEKYRYLIDQMYV